LPFPYRIYLFHEEGFDGSSVHKDRAAFPPYRFLWSLPLIDEFNGDAGGDLLDEFADSEGEGVGELAGRIVEDNGSPPILGQKLVFSPRRFWLIGLRDG